MHLIPNPRSLIPSSNPRSLIPDPFHKGFTLVELLVVIFIIAVLVGILMGAFSGTTESARATHCLSNMKSLANAVQSYHLADEYGNYVVAQSYESMWPDISNGELKYGEHTGWISWYSKGLYPADSTKEDQCEIVSLYSTDIEKYQYALSNGSLYKFVGGNTSVYVCPVHKDQINNVHWSYLMNQKNYGAMIKNGALADRILLFAEVPFRRGGPGEWFPNENSTGEDADAVLQYETENIGGNHKSGRMWMAHVVFADCHTEKLRVSDSRGNPMSSSDIRQLTEWLCLGEDISFNVADQKYEKLTK